MTFSGRWRPTTQLFPRQVLQPVAGAHSHTGRCLIKAVAAAPAVMHTIPATPTGLVAQAGGYKCPPTASHLPTINAKHVDTVRSTYRQLQSTCLMCPGQTGQQSAYPTDTQHQSSSARQAKKDCVCLEQANTLTRNLQAR
jgi:hypothetical protein